MEPLKKGAARIEFFAVRNEIEKLLSAGYSIKLAYDHLKEVGKITMSYQAFYRNLKPKVSSASQVPETRQPEGKLGIGKESTIQHEKNPNINEII